MLSFGKDFNKNNLKKPKSQRSLHIRRQNGVELLMINLKILSIPHSIADQVGLDPNLQSLVGDSLNPQFERLYQIKKNTSPAELKKCATAMVLSQLLQQGTTPLSINLIRSLMGPLLVIS